MGGPSPDRLHKASKACPRVVVYAWKNVPQLVAAIAERNIHRADQLVVRSLPLDMLDAVAETLDRSKNWDLAVAGGTLYLTIGERLFEGAVETIAI